MYCGNMRHIVARKHALLRGSVNGETPKSVDGNMKSATRLCVFGLILSLCSCAFVYAQATKQQDLYSVAFPLEMVTTGRGYGPPLVRVILNHKVHGTFLVDTGTGNTLVSDAIVRQLGVVPVPVKDKDGKDAKSKGSPISLVHVDMEIEDMRVKYGSTKIPMEMVVLNKLDITLVVDTGAEGTIIPMATVYDLNLKPVGDSHPVNLLSGHASVYEVMMERINFGALVQGWSRIYCTDGMKGLNQTLGIDLLSRYRLLLDGPNKKLYLKPYTVAEGVTQEKK